jgi:tight adherence protein B
MSEGVLIFLAMVFTAVFLLSQGIVIPVFGEGNKVRKRLKERLTDIEAKTDEESFASLLRAKYLRKLSPLERRLENLPGMEQLAKIIDQAGHQTLAYRLALLSLIFAVVGTVIGWGLTRSIIWAPLVGLVALAMPIAKILRDRKMRIERFEEQLPDAIDSMKRALRAGHPFSAALKLVAEDMDDPVAREFELTFADINYGNDLRRAMLGMLQRVPSLTVMALITAVLVQKETGGNLAEILDQISSVIRGRFKFYRRVKTLSAEGRLSAWILTMVPFALFAVISFTTPEYLPVLLDDPTGRQAVMFGFGMMVVGIYWIRRIIRIDV